MGLASSGGLSVGFAVLAPVLIMFTGLAFDYAMMVKYRGDLQSVADAAALAGAREISLSNSDADSTEGAAEAYAAYLLGVEPTKLPEPDADSEPGQELSLMARVAGDDGADEPEDDGGGDDGGETPEVGEVIIDAEMGEESPTLQVEITKAWQPLFAHFLASRMTPIRVSATATFVGRQNICVLGLSPSTTAGVTLWNNAQLTANNCSVYSNTGGSAGLVVADSGQLRSQLNCVVGGYSIDNAKSVEPMPISDCPPLDDPLADRPPPTVGACDFQRYRITEGVHELIPGVYCGGLSIGGTAKATLANGIYIIKDGPFTVTSSATLTVENAGFYLTGMFSTVWFSANTTISMSAPLEGPLAGLLFFEDRAASGLRIHRIASNNARTLLGTIYTPRGILNIDATAPVADQSAYTAIIALSLQLQSGPNLILNSDYGATDVPVPEGISGVGQVLLSE
jgi:Putative Flp pilus-assembly TadE/G-like